MYCQKLPSLTCKDAAIVLSQLLTNLVLKSIRKVALEDSASYKKDGSHNNADFLQPHMP